MSVLHVVFKVAGTEYALPADEVLQMESYSGATPIPGAAAHVAGIVQVRGRVVPVVDLRSRFGLDAAERTLDSRLVIGQDAGRSVALLVDSAREVVKLEPEQVEPPPPVVADEAKGFVRAVARLGERLLMLIDFKKVIGEVQVHG
ncbi:MAG TPA: chemotaxis protein CheW [Polyangia bacterium]